MKKIILAFLIVLLITGCEMGNRSAKSAVTDYLNNYKNLSTDVLIDLEKVVENETTLNEKQKDIYREILKKQYKDLKYEIIDETYDGDSAIVDTKIIVYDLYKAQKEASEYLKNNIESFYNANNQYDNAKYLDYKLNKMKNTMQTIEYEIIFNVFKENDYWKLKEITSTDLEKIHGIYNYES